MLRTLAVLPVKRFDLAKQRLSAELSPDFRRQLAEAMVGDVLDALAACADLEATLVVTNEASVAAAARAGGATVAADPHETGQSAAALVGIEQATAGGFDRVLLVPGDCPAVDPAELTQLLGQPSERPSVMIVPDRHGTGTNALLLNPPSALVPSFGPGSLRRHRERAEAAGVTATVRHPSSLLLDVDTPADLATLRAELGQWPGLAVRTRAVLARTR